MGIGIFESSLEAARAELENIIGLANLEADRIHVRIEVLTPKKAIGDPHRKDFPLVAGKERVIEAVVEGAAAHAFTDSPGAFSGSLKDVLFLPLDTNRNRAVFTATLNAVLRRLGFVEKTLHCRDEDPERCARELSAHVAEKWGVTAVGLIGLNPAIADALIKTFGSDRFAITDLDPETIGTSRDGVTVWDGRSRTAELIYRSQVVLATGTTLVNGTFDAIRREVARQEKKLILYGVTCAGVCSLMGFRRHCPHGLQEPV